MLFVCRFICSRSEDYYIQKACGPDPYIDRLVKTVLALPRPQLSPPEDRSTMSADELALPEASSETLMQNVPEKMLNSAPVKEKAVLTESCTRGDKGVQTTVDSHNQLADLSQVSDKTAQAAGTETWQMHTLGSSKSCGTPSVPSVRRPLPPSPRRCGEHGCRDQQPQPTDAVELCIVTGSSMTGSRGTICSSMTGVVERMPVGPNASAVTAGSSRVLRAVQRTHSTPPRRKLGHRKGRLNTTPPHVRKPKQAAEETTGTDAIDGFVECAKADSETSRPDACKGGDAGSSPLSVSLTDSSDGESAFISPARRIKMIEAGNDSDSQLHQLVSRDVAKEALAAMDSFSPVASDASTCNSPVAAPTSLEKETWPHRTLPVAATHDAPPARRRQETAKSVPEPEPEQPRNYRRNGSQKPVSPTHTLWGNIPSGETEAVLRASPGAAGSPSMLSPIGLQHLSGCSDAISVPSDPGQETLCFSQAPSPVQQNIRVLKKLAVDIAGSWQAVMKEIVPKSPSVQNQTTVLLAEPPTGSDLEELYAQHKRTEVPIEAVEGQRVQTLCCFELQQLGDDFVTGYHVRYSILASVAHFCFVACAFLRTSFVTVLADASCVYCGSIDAYLMFHRLKAASRSTSGTDVSPMRNRRLGWQAMTHLSSNRLRR